MKAHLFSARFRSVSIDLEILVPVDKSKAEKAAVFMSDLITGCF